MNLQVGLRIAVFLSAAPLATTFSGALAYVKYSTNAVCFCVLISTKGITAGHSQLAKWRLLFLVEGLPTICMAPVAYIFFPDTPDKARFLTEEEKVGARFLRKNAIADDALKLIAKARGVRQVGSVNRVGGIAWKEVGLALLDLKCWFTAVSKFLEPVSFRKANTRRLLLIVC